MGPKDLLSRQLSHPSGLGGRLIARAMNRGNRALNARAVQRLELGAAHHVLDLGFGGGASLTTLLDKAAKVTGVDRAQDMVDAAEARYAEAVGAGRLHVVGGDVAALPFADATFDRVLTVNTVYFWPDLEAALAEVHRTVAPGGRLVIGIRDGSVMQQVSRDIFTVRPAQAVADAATAAGFETVHRQSAADGKSHLIVADR